MEFVSILLLLALSAAAVQPNFIRTKVYRVGKDGGTDKDLVTTEYSDGLGRQIQSKVKISDTKDLTSCTFYDDIGRPETSTKVFIDESRPGSYLPGKLSDLNTPTGPLQSLYNDPNAYSYTKYSNDPLSRVIEQNGPGQQFVNNPVKIWQFGVSKETRTVGPDAISFIDGFIKTAMNGPDFDAKLDALSEYISNFQVFTNPTYFLTVSKNPLGNYTQELKNLFGKTEATRATVSGNEIIANYTYDILGNLMEEVAPDPGDQTSIGSSSYTYNTLGQVIKKVTPDGGAFGFAYTVTGQLESDTSYDDVSKAIYRICRYHYDDLDRPVLTEVKNDNDPNHNDWTAVIRGYYDNVDELVVNASQYNIPQWLLSSFENLNGRLVGSVAINKVNGRTYYVSDLFSYDDEGRIKCKIKIVPGIPYQITSFYYDLHGKVLSDTVRCGSKEIIKNYIYDAFGRLEKVVHANNSNKVLATYTYDDLGRLDMKTLAIGSGREITYGYNIREWITGIAPPDGTNYSNMFTEIIPGSQYLPNGSIGNAVYKYSYRGIMTDYDLNYLYDEVNRLTGVTSNSPKYAANFTYDALGRFKTKTEGSNVKPGYKYYTGNSRLKNTGDNADKDYLYDKNGNLVVDKIKKMVIEYDWRDMPVAFRFYNSIPSAIDANDSGEYSISSTEKDLYRYMASQGSGVTPLSQVVMLYDASGNRVIKMEGR